MYCLPVTQLSATARVRIMSKNLRTEQSASMLAMVREVTAIFIRWSIMGLLIILRVRDFKIMRDRVSERERGQST